MLAPLPERGSWQPSALLYWTMPESLEATYDAIRHSVACRVVARDGVVVSGPGALDWLQGQVSQDIGSFAGDSHSPDVGIETLVLSPQGKIESFCRISNLGADRYLLDLRAGFGDTLLARLRRFKLRVKADLEPLENLHSLELRGPGAPAEQKLVEVSEATAVARFGGQPAGVERV